MPLSDLLFMLDLESTKENPKLTLQIENEVLKRKRSNIELKLKEAEPSRKKTMIRILLFSLPFILIGYLLIILSKLGYRDLGNGFVYKHKVTGRSDYQYITKNNTMVIRNSVLDINVFDNIIVGIQLPRCMNTHPQKIALSTEKTYFILNTINSSVTYFVSKKEFQEVLTKLGLNSKVNLNYEYFQNMIDHTLRSYSTSFIENQLDRCNKNPNKQIKHNPLKIEWRMDWQP